MRSRRQAAGDGDSAAELTSSSIVRVVVEAVSNNGAAAPVEFRVGVSTVELWCRDRLTAVFNRDVLGEWLREPGEELVVGDARLSMDWLIDVQGRVALTLPEVNAWALSPTELDVLYRNVVTRA